MIGRPERASSARSKEHGRRGGGAISVGRGERRLPGRGRLAGGRPRPLSKWDVYTNDERITEKVVGVQHTGNVAINTYDRAQYLKDIALMRDLGLNAYRFSLSWPRILPEGTGAVNPVGLDYYHRFVDDLLAAGITPLVTLYHWDFPAGLFAQGRLAQPRLGRLVPRLRGGGLRRARRPCPPLHHDERALHRRLLHGPHRRKHACRPVGALSLHQRAIRPPGAGDAQPAACQCRDGRRIPRARAGGDDRHRPAALPDDHHRPREPGQRCHGETDGRRYQPLAARRGFQGDLSGRRDRRAPGRESGFRRVRRRHGDDSRQPGRFPRRQFLFPRLCALRSDRPARHRPRHQSR